MKPVQRRLRAYAIVAALLLTAGCEDDPGCAEDPRAQVLGERVIVAVGEQVFDAELADDAVERERGWMHRRCDREALLLALPEPGPLPVWGCALSSAIDAVFVADGVVVARERIEPCPEPCGACSIHGEGLIVDAIVEVPAGELDDVEPGAAVDYPAPD